MDTRTTRDAAWAVRAYEAVLHRLPPALPGPPPRAIGGLGDIADRYDAFLLDAFGVLNVGDTPIPGAVEVVASLRQKGRQTLVLTNSASHPPELALQKYRRMGFGFAAADVVSSRDALRIALTGRHEQRWGVMAPATSRIAELGISAFLLGDEPATYDGCDGFVLLGSNEWTEDRQALLCASLCRRPRPVLVGNPDIVAPRETGLTLEPGHYAHRLADETGIEPSFYGKPFANMFDLAFQRLGAVPARRVLMVGDTLHTDVLGGANAGCDTLLLTGSGLFRGVDAMQYVSATGISPTWVAPFL